MCMGRWCCPCPCWNPKLKNKTQMGPTQSKQQPCALKGGPVAGLQVVANFARGMPAICPKVSPESCKGIAEELPMGMNMENSGKQNQTDRTTQSGFSLVQRACKNHSAFQSLSSLGYPFELLLPIYFRHNEPAFMVLFQVAPKLCGPITHLHCFGVARAVLHAAIHRSRHHRETNPAK